MMAADFVGAIDDLVRGWPAQVVCPADADRDQLRIAQHSRRLSDARHEAGPGAIAACPDRGDELDDFTAAPGASNAYGLVGFEANLPGAGKRPLSSMSPTIVLKDGKPVLVTGSPGHCGAEG
jgi:Gamma-glutamyltranspeptidase